MEDPKGLRHAQGHTTSSRPTRSHSMSPESKIWAFPQTPPIGSLSNGRAASGHANTQIFLGLAGAVGSSDSCAESTPQGREAQSSLVFAQSASTAPVGGFLGSVTGHRVSLSQKEMGFPALARVVSRKWSQEPLVIGQRDG